MHPAQAPEVATPEEREQFISELMPHATEAARELGVDPRNLIAQAALETGWGRSLPGGDSHNLFGIKAGSSWSGNRVQANTQEFDAGVASRIDANFRAYGSPRESVEDYVRVIRDNPRPCALLSSGATWCGVMISTAPRAVSLWLTCLEFPIQE